MPRALSTESSHDATTKKRSDQEKKKSSSPGFQEQSVLEQQSSGNARITAQHNPESTATFRCQQKALLSGSFYQRTSTIHESTKRLRFRHQLWLWQILARFCAALNDIWQRNILKISFKNAIKRISIAAVKWQPKHSEVENTNTSNANFVVFYN